MTEHEALEGFSKLIDMKNWDRAKGKWKERPMQVFVVVENEPDNAEFPSIIIGVFSTLELAEEYIKARKKCLTSETGAFDPQDIEAGAVSWETETWLVDGKTAPTENTSTADTPKEQPVNDPTLHELYDVWKDGRREL